MAGFIAEHVHVGWRRVIAGICPGRLAAGSGLDGGSFPPEKVQLWLAILIDATLMVFAGVMAYESTKLTIAVEGQTSAALIWPMKVFYAAIWLQTTMLTLYLARSVVRMIQTGSIKNEDAGVKGGEAL